MSHARVVKKAGHVRVFTVAGQTGSGLRFHVTYACLAPHGRIHRLDNPARDSGPSSASRIAIRGTVVGWALNTVLTGSRHSFTDVDALDLRSGKRRKCASGMDTSVHDLAFGRGGSLAWIAREDEIGPPPLGVGVLSSASSACTTVDTGERIAIGSLAVSSDERVFFWTDDGQPRYAAFR